MATSLRLVLRMGACRCSLALSTSRRAHLAHTHIFNARSVVFLPRFHALQRRDAGGIFEPFRHACKRLRDNSPGGNECRCYDNDWRCVHMVRRGRWSTTHTCSKNASNRSSFPARRNVVRATATTGQPQPFVRHIDSALNHICGPSPSTPPAENYRSARLV